MRVSVCRSLVAPPVSLEPLLMYVLHILHLAASRNVQIWALNYPCFVISSVCLSEIPPHTKNVAENLLSLNQFFCSSWTDEKWSALDCLFDPRLAFLHLHFQQHICHQKWWNKQNYSERMSWFAWTRKERRGYISFTVVALISPFPLTFVVPGNISVLTRTGKSVFFILTYVSCQ